MEDCFKIKILMLVLVSSVAKLRLLREMEDSLMKENVSNTPSSDTL